MAEDLPAEPKSVDERDREWLATVYRGDKEKDLTIRAVLAGMIFGGLMSLSNLYVGLKSGWGLGVDIAAVVVIFFFFDVLRRIGLVRRQFGLMENTITMTVAVAASWISSAGLVSAVPALTMLTGYKFVWWQLTLFIAVILYLGLFMAIPLKRQMIQVDSLRFPANIPTGETLLVMYAHGGEAMKKAVALLIAGLWGVLVAALRDGLGWIPGQLNLPWRLRGITLSKLTLGIEPSLIFISIGGLLGIKVGLSLLLGLVLNYGILAPRLIEAKIIQHPPPQIKAVAAVELPLEVKAGQTFTVQLERAVSRPEFPSPDELKDNPELSSAVRTSVLRYTWTRPTVYSELAALNRDLSAATLQDGSRNPLHGALSMSTDWKALTKAEMLKKAGTPKKAETLTKVEILTIEAPAAIAWEARLSLPKDQPADMVGALGFERGAASLKTVGGFRNISAWSLWPGATVLVVGGLLALAFQWRTLGRTFASIFSGFGGSRNAPKGPLDHIEIPMTWFVFGILFTGVLATLLLTLIFHIHWWMGAVAVVLTFFLAAVAARPGRKSASIPSAPWAK